MRGFERLNFKTRDFFGYVRILKALTRGFKRLNFKTRGLYVKKNVTVKKFKNFF